MNYREQIAMQNHNLALRKSLTEALDALGEIKKIPLGVYHTDYFSEVQGITDKVLTRPEPKSKRTEPGHGGAGGFARA